MEPGVCFASQSLRFIDLNDPGEVQFVKIDKKREIQSWKSRLPGTRGQNPMEPGVGFAS
jgi:hypothetical protein